MKLKDIIEMAVLILVIVLVRTFLVTPIRVNGDSMKNTLEDGNIMILYKFNRENIKRNDIVVVSKNNEKVIKRVVGLPKEDIEYRDNELYINDEKIDDYKFGYGDTKNFKDYCGENEYFVMGDNRAISLDSRSFGCVNKSEIMGTTNFVIFPFTKFGSVK